MAVAQEPAIIAAANTKAIKRMAITPRFVKFSDTLSFLFGRRTPAAARYWQKCRLFAQQRLTASSLSVIGKPVFIVPSPSGRGLG
jgi:hypothetical protein